MEKNRGVPRLLKQLRGRSLQPIEVYGVRKLETARVGETKDEEGRVRRRVGVVGGLPKVDATI